MKIINQGQIFLLLSCMMAHFFHIIIKSLFLNQIAIYLYFCVSSVIVWHIRMEQNGRISRKKILLKKKINNAQYFEDKSVRYN